MPSTTKYRLLQFRRRPSSSLSAVDFSFDPPFFHILLPGRAVPCRTMHG
eukprot:SAG22_NODE_814_length_7044_cov_24.348884_5_plen_49_part_00